MIVWYLYNNPMKFPIPLSSLCSMICGVRGEFGAVRYIRFQPEDESAFVKQGELNMLNTPMYYKQCVSVTPHYFQRITKPCKRLYVSMELWEHVFHNPKMVKEVMQLEEIAPNDYNLLVHVETGGEGQTNKILFHHKWYCLSTIDIHNLMFSSKL